MEPGTHYLAKLELIIMFHGALRKFRGIAQTRATGRVEGGGRGRRGSWRNLILEKPRNISRNATRTYCPATLNVSEL